MPEVLAKFPEKVEFEHIPVDDSNVFALQLLYEQKYKEKSDYSVKLFVGTRCLAGIRDIEENLEQAIKEELSKGAKTVRLDKIIEESNPQQSSRVLLMQRFSRFNLAVIGLAGLLDGINPCAFVTLVFFVSILSLLKKTKREILIIGSTFSISVFVMYLLLGLSAFKVVKALSKNHSLRYFVAMIAVILAFALAFFNFLDSIRFKTSKNPANIKLKLPDRIRERINRLISTKMRFGRIVFGTIILGVLISLLESVCTGQVYLPTIVYILQEGKGNLRAFSCLLFYNFMFILPLLCVFGMTYAGISSQKISAFFSKHLALSKFLLSLLFLILGILLLISL